jgi:FMN reductase
MAARLSRRGATPTAVDAIRSCQTSADMKLIAINASPSDTSKTHAVAAAAVELAAGAGADASLIDVGSLDADALLLRGSHSSVAEAIHAIDEADVLVLVTPIYRATYSGLLKVLLDQLPTAALVGKACILAATAGGPLHFLSIDTSMRAVVASLDGWSVPTVVYATGADFDESNRPGPGVLETLARALDEARRVVETAT